MAVYLDPANFKNIGDGHTIANQINEVLEPYDLGVIAASNDRIGGWQLMYQMNECNRWKEERGDTQQPHEGGPGKPHATWTENALAFRGNYQKQNPSRGKP